MTAAQFDGSEYRRSVLVALRERSPAEVDDLFWLAHVPRDADERLIAARLKDTRGFLNKERTRARQASVATAVLKEWPRVEATLQDPGAREALRRRLGSATEQPLAAPETQRVRRSAPASAEERRQRQVRKALEELARIRDEPELSEDLYAFLGLPVSAGKEMVRERIELVAGINRRRRPDRERALVDDLLVHARRMLVDGDPASYQASFGVERRDRAVDALLSGDADAARAAVKAARRDGVSDGDLIGALAPMARTAEATVPLSAVGLGIWCPSCGTIAASGSATCPHCRAGLQVRCAACQGLAAADSPACPACGSSLEAQRAPLKARRADLQREAQALAELDAAPAAELEARLRALVRQNPNWQSAAARLATLPPPAPRQLTATPRGDDVALRWEAPSGAPVDAYLVECHTSTGARVLGRTALLEWDDRRDRGATAHWTVRSVRGQAISAPATARLSAAADDASASEAARPAAARLQALAGPPIVLTWDDPVSAGSWLERIEERPHGPITRRLTVSGTSYTDRHVGRGRTYRYALCTSERRTAPVRVEVPDAGAGPVPRPAAAPLPQPSTAGITDLHGRRLADGTLQLTWSWPSGVTETFVAWHDEPPENVGDPGVSGRKITNTRYELDHGARLADVPAGAQVAIFAGRRGPSGSLEWLASPARAIAP